MDLVSAASSKRSRQDEIGHGSGRPEIEGEATMRVRVLIKADKKKEKP
jgi:hypothetical protein